VLASRERVCEGAQGAQVRVAAHSCAKTGALRVSERRASRNETGPHLFHPRGPAANVLRLAQGQSDHRDGRAAAAAAAPARPPTELAEPTPPATIGRQARPRLQFGEREEPVRVRAAGRTTGRPLGLEGGRRGGRPAAIAAPLGLEHSRPPIGRLFHSLHRQAGTEALR